MIAAFVHSLPGWVYPLAFAANCFQLLTLLERLDARQPTPIAREVTSPLSHESDAEYGWFLLAVVVCLSAALAMFRAVVS